MAKGDDRFHWLALVTTIVDGWMDGWMVKLTVIGGRGRGGVGRQHNEYNPKGNGARQ